MLALRPGCECCDKDLPPDAADARICSFECTFCADCADRMHGTCPNCGGELVRAAAAAGGQARAESGEHDARAQAGRLRGGAMTPKRSTAVARYPGDAHAVSRR